MSGSDCEYYFIIPDVDDAHVLLVPENGAWTLPHTTIAGARKWQATAHVNRAANEKMGFRATTRRCVSRSMDPGSAAQGLVYALESHSATWTVPSSARWADGRGLAGLRMATPGMAQVLDAWFSWVEDGSNPLRVPWYRAGWMAEAGAWIVEQLARLDSRPSGPIEQVCSWQRSCVLKVPTTHGTAYFKALPASMRTELAVSVLLDHEYPGMVPEILAVDADRGWMLMKDMGSTMLDAVPDLEQWKKAVRAYAQLQVDTVDAGRRFAIAGCPNRGLLQLVESVDRLLADTVVMRPGTASGLTMKQIHALHYRAKALKIAAHRLGTLRLPASLDHGDLWAGQIITGADNSAFIDWSDASLSHPFFSMQFFGNEEELRPYFADAAGARDQLRDVYLEPWTVYEPRDVLTQAWTIACALAPLNAALACHDRIAPVMEVPWETEDMIPFFLRSVLRHQGEALPTLGMADYETQAEAAEYEQAEPHMSEGAVEIRSQLGVQQLPGPR